MIEYLKYSGILLVLIIIQKTLIWLLAVTAYEITPDIVLIGLVYVGIKKGKITGSVGGFVSGLILDLFSFSFLGLMALSKLVAGFVSGYFNTPTKVERYLSSYMFVLIVFLCSLINNIVYFSVYFQGTNLMIADIVLRYILPTTVYTAVLSILPIIFVKRRRFAR